jgi:hypothetical protein
MRSAVLLAAALAATASCVDERPTAPDTVPIEHLAPAPVAISGFDEPARRVVEDEAAWAGVWSRAFGTGPGAPARPAVDFAKERVLVVAAGTRPTGGHAIAVDRVEATAGGLVARVVLSAPGPACAAIQMRTQPLDLVRLTRKGGAVRFESEEKVTDCGP